ncbi:MAG: hypothetical protein IJJ01_08790 [Firmicutes bacterium]|nr:hypothetical protein [Bacillota bacterium]
MFNGRYGMDELGRFMLIVSAALMVLNIFVGIRALWVAAVILLILVYSRAFSRFYDKRRAENMKYLEMKSKFTSGKTGGAGGFSKPGSKPKNDGKRVLICPYCKEKLRVPVGAGKIKINCPHCHNQFEETV